MAVEFCPQCGTERVGAFRFCRSCRFDFDALAPTNVPPAPQTPMPAPSTKSGWSPAERVLVFLIFLAVVLGLNAIRGSGGQAAVPTPTPPPAATPAPTRVAWAIIVDSLRLQTKVGLGDTAEIQFDATNSGRGANPAMAVTVSGLGGQLELASCSPPCDVSTFLGTSAKLPGIPAGDSVTYVLELVATKLGPADLYVCIYDDYPPLEPLTCGEGTMVVGN